MTQLLDFLKGKKTYIVVAIGLVNLYLAYQGHHISGEQVIDEAAKLLGFGTLRYGIATQNGSAPIGGGQKPPTP